LAGASVLTPEETEGIRENLLIGLQTLEKNLDDIITHTNRQVAEAQIWGTIDDEDNAFLVDLMIQAGMRVPAAGQVVRYLANAAWQYRLGMMLVPRFVQTWNFYLDHGGIGRWR
jgi:hypothetical protein